MGGGVLEVDPRLARGLTTAGDCLVREDGVVGKGSKPPVDLQFEPTRAEAGEEGAVVGGGGEGISRKRPTPS